MDILQYGFFRLALLAVVVVSVASAIVGAYVVSRRMVFVAGGITHASFGGLGLGAFMGWNPVLTAAVFAVASALGVEWLAAHRRARQDSAVGVVWALGMALGTIFIFLTPGYAGDLTALLFGNLLMVSRADLIAAAVFLAVLLVVVVTIYRPIVQCAFDRDFARVSGLPVTAVNVLMAVLVSVCVVLTIRMIGIMLLLSLFTLPPMIAEVFTCRLGRIMAASAAVSLSCSVAGLLLSAAWPVPASAAIVLLLVVLYALVRGGDAIKRRVVR